MSEPRDSVKHLQTTRILLFILLLGAALFFIGLNRTPVPTVDGAVRAAMARTVVRSNIWWPVYFEGREFTDHPPLFVWLVALSFKIFGMKAWAFHLIPRLFAVLTLFATYVLGLEIFRGQPFRRTAALLSVVVLCTTRDFLLSSVRGYVEPLLCFFATSALTCLLRALYTQKARWTGLSALSLFLFGFTKGPVVLWPILFMGLILAIRARKQLIPFTSTLALCIALWATWVTLQHQWPEWNRYFVGQVLESALHGRGGQQSLEPLYFPKILTNTYWPWLPALVFAPFTAQTFLVWLFGLGFVAGFSAVKWKFWYYIAPAYPFFAIAVAGVLMHRFGTRLYPILASRRSGQIATAIPILWIIVGSAFPIPLHKDRTPEIAAFEPFIVQQSHAALPHAYTVPTGPIWFVANPLVDHNLISTSGNWSYDRIVEKVEDENAWEEKWKNGQLATPAWIISRHDIATTCTRDWCKKAQLVTTANVSALLLLR